MQKRFFDVEGVPVAFIPTPHGGMGIWACDQKEPRRFSVLSVYRNGIEISEEEFKSMAMSFPSGDSLSQ